MLFKKRFEFFLVLTIFSGDNTLGDTPPDILGLTIAIPTLIVLLLIVLKATFIGCVSALRERLRE